MKEIRFLIIIFAIIMTPMVTYAIPTVNGAPFITPLDSISYTLKKGQRSNDVKELQKTLNLNTCMKSNLLEDGIFGEKTRQAVISFQLERQITADGLVGKNTIYYLKSCHYAMM